MLSKRMIILLSLSILVFGCAASAKKINSLNIGMTRAEVIEVMGEPHYTSGANDIQILSYKLKTSHFFSDTYFVRIKDGKVERFGQQGSFGSYF